MTDTLQADSARALGKVNAFIRVNKPAQARIWAATLATLLENAIAELETVR
jgi:hypothetical protein